MNRNHFQTGCILAMLLYLPAFMITGSFLWGVASSLAATAVCLRAMQAKAKRTCRRHDWIDSMWSLAGACLFWLFMFVTTLR